MQELYKLGSIVTSPSDKEVKVTEDSEFFFTSLVNQCQKLKEEETVMDFHLMLNLVELALWIEK
jgi:hypothetical protein